MLIKGRSKPEKRPKQEDSLKSTILKNHKEGLLAAVHEAPRKADAEHSLIKKGELPFEPVPLFLSEAAELEDSGIGTFPEEALSSEQKTAVAVEEDPAKIREMAEAYLAKAKAGGEKILAEAQAKANKLIEQTKLYCQTAKANAEREGLAEGKEKAHEDANLELRALMEQARDTFRQTRELHDNLARSMEGGLAKLAIKIAERVIAREVSLDPDVVLAMVRSQLEKMKDRDHVVIHVNPEDYPNVQNKKNLFAQFAPLVKSLEIQADPRVDRGGCMVETNLGTVDASISTQLEAIELAFAKAERVEGAEEGHVAED